MKESVNFRKSISPSGRGSELIGKGNEKTFLTQQNKDDENSGVWKAFDFLYPAGRLAKLVHSLTHSLSTKSLNMWVTPPIFACSQVKIADVYMKNFPYSEIMEKLKLTSGIPVINLIGAAASQRGKFYAGVARAGFRCDAAIVGSAIQSGIEPHVLRRGKNITNNVNKLH